MIVTLTHEVVVQLSSYLKKYEVVTVGEIFKEMLLLIKLPPQLPENHFHKAFVPG
jgi:hypothetical protein